MRDSSKPDSSAVEGIAAIVLAAGKSTRMRSKLPKPLHLLCGLPITNHVVRSCRSAGVNRVVVVVGHEAETVQAGLGTEVEYAFQSEPRGTGHAVLAARSQFLNWSGTILVLAGDIPLMPPTTLRRLLDAQRASVSGVAMLTAHLDDATGYGRIIRDEQGSIVGIIEQSDATPEQHSIKEWNPSIYAFQSELLWSALAEIRPQNAQGEYYLTDVIAVLKSRGITIESVAADCAEDVLGINNRVELSTAAGILRKRIQKEHMLAGVSIVDPSTTYIDSDVSIGQDTSIEPCSFLGSGTVIGEDCVIGPMARITRSVVGDKTRIWASHVTDSQIGDRVSVGPYANLRVGTVLAEKVKIGDFVETKKAIFGTGAQASHLSYIGDASVGAGTNIGAGTVTCNFDGFMKHDTTIGQNAFVGSHSTLVAPVVIGDGAIVAAGSVITNNVSADALAIARSRMTLKEGRAALYRADKSAAAAARAAASEGVVEPKRVE